MHRLGLLLAIGVALTALGCVRRTITITSTPPGALVWLNSREVGRTPIEVDFLYYGEYDVQLVADGYEPLLTSGKANPPWWDSIPFDLFAEMTPGEHRSNTAWHYELQPRNDDRAALVERARQLQQRLQPADESAAAVPNP